MNQQQQQTAVFNIARHNAAVDQAAAAFIKILTDSSIEITSEAQNITFRVQTDRPNDFFVQAHGIRLLAKFEHVFAEGSERRTLYGSFSFYQENVNGDFDEIGESIVFTEHLAFYFPDRTELVIEMGRGNTLFKTRVHAQLFSMIQSRLKVVPRPDLL